jgi:hypothetical protein
MVEEHSEDVSTFLIRHSSDRSNVVQGNYDYSAWGGNCCEVERGGALINIVFAVRLPSFLIWSGVLLLLAYRSLGGTHVKLDTILSVHVNVCSGV